MTDLAVLHDSALATTANMVDLATLYPEAAALWPHGAFCDASLVGTCRATAQTIALFAWFEIGRTLRPVAIMQVNGREAVAQVDQNLCLVVTKR